jgi:hypothetical protein
MSKYPKDDDLDTFERDVLKYLWNNVSIDMSIRNRSTLEQEIYRKFAKAFSDKYRKIGNKILDALLEFSTQELKQDD